MIRVPCRPWRALSVPVISRNPLLEVQKGASLNDAFRQLSEQGFDIVSMRNRSNRLELFMSMVGKNLPEQNGEAVE